MSSLARGLAVIRGFSNEERHLSVAQLSQKTGIPRAAVRRCLYTLNQLGYVSSRDGRDYSLQPKLLGLGHAYLSSTPLVVNAQPFLDRVSDAVKESCSLAILDGEDILYIARAVSS
jgi:IclR family pca regulon transcriptional regulator